MFLRKGILKICSKFTGEHQSRSAISIKFHNNFTEIALRHGCSPVDLLHISRKPFPRNTSGWLPLNISKLYLHFTLDYHVRFPSPIRSVGRYQWCKYLFKGSNKDSRARSMDGCFSKELQLFN